MSHSITQTQTGQQIPQPQEKLFLVLSTEHGRKQQAEKLKKEQERLEKIKQIEAEKLRRATEYLEKFKQIEAEKKKKIDALYEEANRIDKDRTTESEEQRKRILAVAKERKDSTLPDDVEKASERMINLGKLLTQAANTAQGVATTLNSSEVIFQKHVHRTDQLAEKI